MGMNAIDEVEIEPEQSRKAQQSLISTLYFIFVFFFLFFFGRLLSKGEGNCNRGYNDICGTYGLKNFPLPNCNGLLTLKIVHFEIRCVFEFISFCVSFGHVFLIERESCG